MNFDIKYLKSGIIRVTVAHVISIIITGILTFIVPMCLDSFDYGLWQLYVFYFGYIGFFHLGWADGVYLNLLGKDYDKLDKPRIKSDVVLFFIFQLVTALVIFALSFLMRNFEKAIIIRLLSLSLLVTNFRFYFIYVLQACGKVKEYSNVQLLERVLIVVIFVILITIQRNFRTIIYADILAKSISLVLALYYCRELVLVATEKTSNSILYAFSNINAGSKLMIANIASILTTGVLKFAIEKNFGIVEFGKVSLAITFSNLCVNILNSMGVVFIPLIKNKDISTSKSIYNDLHFIINIFTFFVMAFYYPIKTIASGLLIDYIESFDYLSLTFPILYFCCLQAILHSTYIKALRQEKQMMNINIITIAFSVVYTMISIYAFKSFILCVVGLTLVYFLKISLYDYIIIKKLNSDTFIKFFTESTVLCLCFCIFNYCIKGMMGMIGYALVFLVYFFINFDMIKRVRKLIINLNK